jgi:antitoxin component YwqK of YwqJK toxin-antitoxin module
VVRIYDVPESSPDDPEDDFTGIWETYWPNGNLKSRTTYLNGLEHGDHLCVWENGRVSQYGKNVDGDCRGLWTDYRENGTKLLEGIFGVAGKVGIWSYFQGSGIVSTQQEFHDGVEHGLWQEYDPEGEIKLEGEHREGRPFSGVLRIVDLNTENYHYYAEFKDSREVRKLF